MKTNNTIKQITKLKNKLNKYNEKIDCIIKKCNNKTDYIEFEELRKAIINYDNTIQIIDLIENTIANFSFFSDDESYKLKKIIHSNNDIIIYLSCQFDILCISNQDRIDKLIDKLVDLLQKLERSL